MRILGLLLAGALALPAVTPEAAAEAEKEMFAARFDRAAELYSRLLQQDPHWAQGYYGLVRSLLGAYRAPEAYTAGEDALRNAPDKAESLTAAGMALFRRGDLAQ